VGVLAVALVTTVCQPSDAEKRYPGESWEKADTPEELGWSSEKLKRAKEYSDSIDTVAVMVIHDGKVLDEWGETTKRFRCHSIRKSFLSALYGIHAKEGRINLSSTLEELGIDDMKLNEERTKKWAESFPGAQSFSLSSLTETEKQARVSDLLKARSGVYHPVWYESASVRESRPERGSHEPGTFWFYHNWDFNALLSIFERETKKKIFEEFKKRIADPLQMEDFRLEDTEYLRGPDSIHYAYPFRMTARDMARFGLLYIRQGLWRGKQIIPKDWVEESTKSYSDAGKSGGYGYLWWVAVNGKHFPNVELKDGAYSARGSGGHYIVVLPDIDLVVVHRVDTDIRSERVSADEFGRLLGLILDARIKM
jgi:CubicO group peptidase (beta-lactamase class C family)